MNRYTEKMEDSLYVKWGILDNMDDEYGEIIEHLNSSEFRTYGDGLRHIISSKLMEGEEPVECIKRLCKEKSIEMTKELASLNTIKNWFSGGERPKKSEESRRKLFVLAFVLELTTEQTAYLFQHVYLDRAFNKRNPKELIYYYCLDKKMTLSQADELILKINVHNNENNEQTIYTSLLGNEIKEMENGNDVVEYINSNPHNFSINNITANNKVCELIKKAKQNIAEEITKQGYEELTKGKSIDSNNFMYEIITGQSVTSEKGTKTIFKNADLPKEIRTSFPEAVTFSKKEPTYDELRKMIILLFSYCFWNQVSNNALNVDIDDYLSELDTLLHECGLPCVYPGNPFDWLFCFCTLSERPLDVFRSIINDVLKEDK